MCRGQIYGAGSIKIHLTIQAVPSASALPAPLPSGLCTTRRVRSAHHFFYRTLYFAQLIFFEAVRKAHPTFFAPMPNYRRANITGGTYFFTVNTLRRLPILTEPPVRAALREAIRQTRAIHSFDIDAWVLLPDHLHCIWTLPEGDADFSIRWAKIKRYVSKECRAEFGAQDLSESRNKRREAGLWQRRFWEHQIRDDADLARHVDYIHWNPVKHELVAQASDWPYSTFHRYVGAGVYSSDWGLSEALQAQVGE